MGHGQSLCCGMKNATPLEDRRNMRTGILKTQVIVILLYIFIYVIFLIRETLAYSRARDGKTFDFIIKSSFKKNKKIWGTYKLFKEKTMNHNRERDEHIEALYHMKEHDEESLDEDEDVRTPHNLVLGALCTLRWRMKRDWGQRRRVSRIWMGWILMVTRTRTRTRTTLLPSGKQLVRLKSNHS